MSVILTVPQLRVKCELTLAVHRAHEGAALAVECHVHPGGRMRNTCVEVGGAQVDREHSAAEKIAHRAGLPGVLDAKGAPRRPAGAIAAGEVARPDGARLAV